MISFLVKDLNTGKTEDWSNDFNKMLQKNNRVNQSSNMQNQNVSQQQIQQRIQSIAPNPTRYGNNNPVSNTQGFNGVNQATQGILGFLKSLYTNPPQLKPHKATSPLSNDWFNETLQNIQAHNRQKIGIGLQRTFGSVLNNIITAGAQQNIAKMNNQTRLDATKMTNDTRLNIAKIQDDTAKHRNQILDMYYKGLLSNQQAQSELKKLDEQYKLLLQQQKGQQDLYKARYNKYPDIQTFNDNLLSQAYDYDIEAPKEEIVKAYNYYLKTGELPKPIVSEKDGFFGKSNVITGFDYGSNQQQTNTKPEKVNNNNNVNTKNKQTDLLSQIDILKQEAEKQFGAKVTGTFQDPNGNIYFALENGKYIKVQ